eukprot:470042_1
MTMKKEEHVTVYGNIVIPYNTQKIHQWQFKIKQSKNYCDLGIGIDEASYKSLKTKAHWNTETNNYVCNGDAKADELDSLFDEVPQKPKEKTPQAIFDTSDSDEDDIFAGCLYSKDKLSDAHSLNLFTSGDTLTMELNGITKMLSFQVNNQDKQNAYEIEQSKIGYSMVVTTLNQNDSVQLLSYKYMDVTDNNKLGNVSANDNDDKKTFWQDEKLKLIEERDIAKAQSESLKSELVGKEKEINNFKNEIKLLKEKNNKLMYDNGKLLDDQKGMEIEINKLKKENKELRRNNINTKNYKQWNWEQIIFWILSLDDGKYNQYENQLMKHLKEEAIEGDDLTEIKEDDLMRWGIKKFKDKKNVMKYIKQLTNNNHQNVDNEGGKPAPTAYI